MNTDEKKVEALKSQVRRMITTEKEFPSVLVDLINWEEAVELIDERRSTPESIFLILMGYARKYIEVSDKIVLVKKYPLIKEHIMDGKRVLF